jgi:predicted transcriptional regulator
VDAQGRVLGYNESSKTHENWLIGATMILAGEHEYYYFSPGDFSYTIRGLAPGDFTFILFSPGDFSPGDFSPGDFTPGDFTGRTYQLSSRSASGSLDKIEITSDSNTIIITSNSDKFYSLYITNGSQRFVLKNVPLNRNSTHNYTITNWSALGLEGQPSINLVVDDMPDKVWALWNNFNITDIFKPDLAIIEFEISKSRAKPGENITVRVIIKNLGNCPARNIKVRFLVSNQSYEEIEILLLARGATEEITFYWSSNSIGYYILSVRVDPDNEIKEINENNNMQSATIEIIKEVIAPAPSPQITTPLIGGAIATTIVVLAALLGTEVGKYSLFSLFAPLYIKRKYAVLDQFTRGRIYEHIKLNPGTHYNSIRSSLDLGNGTISYHLSILEKEGYIRSESEGMYKRFYPVGKVNTFNQAHLPLSDLQQEIIEQIKLRPGITQKELSRITNKSHQVISYNIKVLTRFGIINEEKEGMRRKLYIEEKYAG